MKNETNRLFLLSRIFSILLPVFFITLPVCSQDKVKIALWGDSRSNKNNAAENIADILLHKITDWDFQVHSGDFTPGGEDDDWQKALGYKFMDSLVVQGKFFMCTSNHDDYEGKDHPADYYYNKYTKDLLPTNSADGTTHFYHHQKGNVHVVSCDAYFTNLSVMNVWLDKELSTISEEDWLIGVWHNPCYGDITYKSSYLDKCGLWLEKFHEHGGDFILHGHAHVYVRTHPLLPDETVDDKNGMIHIINGTGGASWEPPQPKTAHTAFTPADSSFACITFITFDSVSALVQTIDARPNQNLKIIDEFRWQKGDKNN